MKFFLTLLPLILTATLSQAELVGFYSFDDPASPLTDDSGMGNTLESAAADPTHVAAGGVEGGAFEFDGFQRLIAPININPTSIPELTLGAWVKTASLDPGLRKVMGHDDGGWDRTIGLDDRDTGEFRYTTFVGNRRPLLGTPGPASVDDWTFLAVTYDQPNNEVTIYIDIDSSTTADALVSVSEPSGFGAGHSTFSIGSLRPDTEAESWVGFIDNVFVFDELLDAGQIRQIRDGGKAAVTGDLAPNDPAIAVTSGEVFGLLPSNPGRQERSVTIANQGSANTLTLSSVTITGPQMAFYEVVSAPATVAPGATADIVVAFDPDNTVGEFNATLVIASNDAAVPEVTADLFAKVPEGTSSDVLLAFYTFDDPTNPLRDGSGHDNALQEPGGDANPTYGEAAGIQGGAYTFDGGDRLIAPININPDEVPELTVGVWVKTSTLEPGLRKVIGHDNGGWDRTIGLDDREGEFRYTSFVGNGPPVMGTPGPESTEAWTFLAVTYDQPNNEVTVFVDSDVSSIDDPLVQVTAPSGFTDGFDTFSVGSLRPDNANEAWQGEIDNLFLAQGILTGEQLDQVRAGGRSAIELLGFGPPRESLLALWNFDDVDAPTADSSGNDNVIDDTVAPPDYLPDGGFEGGGYEFNGSQRLIADIDINVDQLPEMTWGAWVKPANLTPALKKIMGHDDGAWDRTIGLDNREGDFRYMTFTGTGPSPDTPSPVNAEDWTFIAVTYDEPNAEATVYVDLDAGTVGDDLIAVSTPTSFNTGHPQFSIGSLRPDNSNEGWQGLIDNVFLYNRILSPAQLAFVRDGGNAVILGATGDDPDLTFSRDVVFGSLGSDDAVTRSIPIQNGGRSQTLTLSSVAIEGPDAAFYMIDSFPENLSPGGSGTVVITFDPQGQVGAFDAQLRMESNDTSQGVTILKLQATTPGPAEAGPQLAGPIISPFGSLTPGEHTRMIPVENTGTGRDLVVTNAEIAGRSAVNYSLGALPGPIAPGASGQIEVTFNSGGDFGNFAGTLRLTSNDVRGRLSDIDVSAVVPVQNPEDALIAFYSFDDPNDPLKDDSETGNDLTIPDGADPIYDSMAGFEGSGAFEFDGGQRLVAPIDINVDQIPELTLGAWVKPTDLSPGLKKVIGHDDGGWDRTIGLDNREGEFRYTSFMGNGRPVVGTPGPENTDDWTFLAVVYDQPNNEVTVYVDLDAATTDDELVAVSEPTNFNTGQPTVSIGSLRPDNGNEGWVGLIDRAFFFKAAFDSDTIRELRDGGILPGAQDPNIRLSGGFGDLGKNPGMVSREITLRNGGREQVLTISDTRITGPDAANFTLEGTLPPTLDPGEAAMLSITFNPNGREGGFVAFLEVDSNDEGDPTETLDLSALIPSANDLLAHYKLDETDGVTMLDASGNGRHGTYTAANGGSFTLGQDPLAAGTAVAFDDAGDTGAGFGEVPSGAGLPELTNFSVSLWMNQAASDTGVSALFAKGEGAGDPFAVATVGGALVWFSAGTQTLTVDGAITPGELTHVVTTFETVDGIPTAAFFVNGVEVGREENVEPFDDSRASIFQIGALNGAFGFTGVIDDVQLYGQALDAEDVQFLFENPGELVPGDEAPPAAARISGVSVNADGVSLTLTGDAAVDVQYSIDLMTWEVIASDVTSSFEDNDPTRNARPEGYYRVGVGN